MVGLIGRDAPRGLFRLRRTKSIAGGKKMMAGGRPGERKGGRSQAGREGEESAKGEQGKEGGEGEEGEEGGTARQKERGARQHASPAPTGGI